MTGHTDTSGPEAYNMVREGVPATAIAAVIGRGEAGLLVRTADDDRPLGRLVFLGTMDFDTQKATTYKRLYRVTPSMQRVWRSANGS